KLKIGTKYMPTKNNQKRLLVLLILDGWGIAPPSKGNAITLAKTPTMDKLFKKYPHCKLSAYDGFVGLPEGQDGNSEAGHMNLGAGRIIEQDALIINRSIDDGTFFKNPALFDAIRHAENNKSNLHLMGLLSGCQSPHSSPKHFYALLKLIRENFTGNVFLHLFTDGMDAPQYESVKLIEKMQENLRENERIVSISGRFYAMDRKKSWERTEKVYNAITLCSGIMADDPINAITTAYNRGENDGFIKPTIIIPPVASKYFKGRRCEDLGNVGENDAIIFFNLRSDRARQLAKPFVQHNFNKMNKGAFIRRKVIKNLKFVAMTDFGPDLENILTAYPTKDIEKTLPMVLKDLKQLYIAETEKYAHMTYFFNGGYSKPVGEEDRIMVPSPDVKSYDETPCMSINKVVDNIKDKLKDNKYDFIAANFANPDMIGHTGNLKAGIEAIEAADKAINELTNAVLKKKGIIIITADHGNIEEMINLKTGEIDTKHSTNPVPFILAGNNLKIKKLRDGILGDVAPTILELLDIEKPKEMEGESLIKGAFKNI
ncbi:MAG: 2,3-bisphosphoglycerate-independent phosphoglycerate mutase, partial [bacterium]